MKKYHQKQLLEIVETLNEANAEIKRLFLRGKLSATLQLLGDCQMGAAQIGEFIETVKGEGTQTVALLEEYHESLYRAGEEIETADAGFVKRLQKQLLRIENSVRNELAPDRIEVAFFPYKASMWDSLESIWLAAKDDSECDAYVVPIPYFDRLSGGTFGQMHYEGDSYPDYVPVVDWRTYHLEERRPDIIFIHNPYDEGNLVTSVHPDYYSGRLKDLSELLCYVPYFVVSDDVPEHFVLCSGVLNADRVFLQSERVRDTYIRVFKKFEKEHRCADRFGKAEKKFVVLGSPKFDRVSNIKRSDCNLPEDWGKLTENKKVILYNTSIGALLQGGEQYLKKLRSVLDTFHGRNDVVLWWRPHPLSEVTYQSMRPHLFAEYEQIVADYRRGGWGIYDDTPDLYRAIAMSDGYFGDHASSLVALYQAADKPIMTQNVYEQALSFENLIEVEGSYYFSAQEFNGLFKLDINTCVAEFVGHFPNEKLFSRRLHSDIARYGNKLIFVPFSAQTISIFDLSSNKFSTVAIDEYTVTDYKTVKYIPDFKFWFCETYDDNVFFFPRTFPAVLKLDLETMQLTYLSEPISSLNEMLVSDAPFYFRKHVRRGNCIISWCTAANALVQFDMATQESTMLHHLKSAGLFIEALPSEEGYWLVPYSKGAKLCKLSFDFKNISYVETIGACDSILPYFCSVISGDFLWLFPGRQKNVLKMNIKDEAAEIVNVFDLGDAEKLSPLATIFTLNFAFAKHYGSKIVAFEHNSKKFFEYDIHTKRLKKSFVSASGTSKMDTLAFSEEFARRFDLTNEGQRIPVNEDCPRSLTMYLDYLTQYSNDVQSKHDELRDESADDSLNLSGNGKAGQAIYNYAKGLVLL